MFYGAIPATFERVKWLRKNSTEAENVLWEIVKGKQLGSKFRRQHPVAQYIVDFYCHQYRLIIELDGEYHLEAEQQRKDEERQKVLEDYGLTILRFTNEEVFINSSEVIQKINLFCAQASPF